MDDASAKPLLHDSASAILPLFAWLSPSYPVGSYAYSHTLEWAVEAGDVTDEATLVAWLRRSSHPGFRAQRRHPPEPCLSRRAGGRPRRPRRSQRAGARPLAVIRTLPGNEPAGAQLPRRDACRLAVAAPDSALKATWPFPSRSAWPPRRMTFRWRSRSRPTCSVSCRLSSLPRSAWRLSGRRQGSASPLRLPEPCATWRGQGIRLTLDDIGGATFRADLGSFHHENQYTRLFRS